jgi:hypothetical protein
MYDKGKGVPQDYKIAVKWYRLAAEQGNAIAQSILIKIKKLIKTEEKEKQDQVKRQTNPKDTITTIPDGRTVVLNDDGAWKILQSSDLGKLVLSVVSMVPHEDSHGYEGCKITYRARNMTKYELSDWTLGFVVFTPTGQFEGTGGLSPNSILSTGDTVERQNHSYDTSCSDVSLIRVSFADMTKRGIKGLKFSNRCEASRFFSKLLAISSDHNGRMVEFRTGNIPIVSC